MGGPASLLWERQPLAPWAGGSFGLALPRAFSWVKKLFSEARPGESKRRRTLFTRYFPNSNDVPSTEHMALSGAGVKCLEEEGRQRAVTQDKVVGALQKMLLY